MFDAATYTVDLCIARSTIPEAGLGCYSMANIEVRMAVAPHLRERFRRLAQTDIPRRFLKYCVLLDEGDFLCPSDFSKLGQLWFVNHAREPNCVFEKNRLFARRPIRRGEELTVYYTDLLRHPSNAAWVRPHHI